MSKQTIKIYGASDDLIEVEGRVNGCDEYGSGKGVVVCEPSGDTFRVEYGSKGIWRVTHEIVSGALEVSIEEAPDEEDGDVYTDTYTISGEINRVRFGESGWPPDMSEIRERTERAIEDMRDLSDEAVVRIWEVLGQP